MYIVAVHTHVIHGVPIYHLAFWRGVIFIIIIIMNIIILFCVTYIIIIIIVTSFAKNPRGGRPTCIICLMPTYILYIVMSL